MRVGRAGGCGSTLTSEGDRLPTEVHFHIGAFNVPEQLAREGAAFAEERLAWLHLQLQTS